MSAAIEVRGLTHRYGDKTAIDGVDFTVPWGSIVGYLGPNGSGKTTTMKAIAGLLQPSEGSVRLNGHDPYADGMRARSALGFVPDDGGLYELLSGREHLALVSDLHQLDPTEANALQEELVEAFEMQSFLDRRIDTLSKGQRQRVALCCGLLHRPRVLVLDEPLTGLDVAAVREVRRRLQALAEDGGAVLYSSHILDVVERLCDRAVILAEGKVVADAPTAELVADKSLESAFHALTRAEDEIAGALGEAEATVPEPGQSKPRKRKKGRK